MFDIPQQIAIRRLLLAGKCQHARSQIQRADLLAQLAPATAEIARAATGIQYLLARMRQPHPQ
ncbi:hypothetical protein D3C71_1940500 [compost metagenome]